MEQGHHGPPQPAARAQPAALVHEHHDGPHALRCEALDGLVGRRERVGDPGALEGGRAGQIRQAPADQAHHSQLHRAGTVDGVGGEQRLRGVRPQQVGGQVRHGGAGRAATVERAASPKAPQEALQSLVQLVVAYGSVGHVEHLQ